MRTAGEIGSKTAPSSDDPRWALVQRILSSRSFEKSARLREFLTFIAQQTLTGDTGTLKEQAIGCAVFGKPAGYETLNDNVVRVQARQLRLKLEEYFRTEGSSEPVIIDIPKGTYVPVFAERSQPAAKEAAAPVAVSNPWKRISLVLGALLALAVAALVLQRASPSSPEAPWPLSSVRDGNRRTLIVVSDPLIQSIGRLARRSIRLEEYTQSGYPEALMPADAPPESLRLLDLMSRLRVTSGADVVLAVQIASAAVSERTAIRLAREVRFRELQESNLILIGGPGSNPWVTLYMEGLNFQWGSDPASGATCFTNRRPLKGEEQSYVTYSRTPSTGPAFGIVALLKHPSHSGSVLLIQGATMEASEGVGKFIVDPAGARRLRERMPSARHFEALLRTQAIGGSATNTEIVATRIHEY